MNRLQLLKISLLLIPGLIFPVCGLDAVNVPTRLSINFLTHAGQVFLDGYPVNTPVAGAASGTENYEYAEIAQQQPFFGWVVPSAGDSTLQTGYRILVSSSMEKIRNDTGDIWDSGKVENDESINVRYKGKPLEPGNVYYWKVKTWDNHGVESGYSAVSGFRTAVEMTDYATARYPLQKQDEYPLSIKPVSDSLAFIDFGKDAFGRLRISLEGRPGMDSITIRLGEAEKNGRVDREPGGTIRYSVYKLGLRDGWNTYIIAIRPDKRNTRPGAIRMPAYTGEVTPFRYCEIEGYPSDISEKQVIRETTFYPFDETDSYFTSSDSILNAVWDLCKYSIKATSFTGTYVDGDRERKPYEADALINQLGQYGVTREYSMARHSLEYLIFHATWPTEWILQTELMAWHDYMYTGNTSLFEKYYDELKAKTMMPLEDKFGFISSRTGKVTPGLLDSIHLDDQLRDNVDWPHSGGLGLSKKEPGETDGFVFEDVNTVVNAYYYRALEIMARVAGITDRKEDSTMFAHHAARLKKSFHVFLFNKLGKVYRDGIGTRHASLHANMFPLEFGLVPEKYDSDILRFIRSRGMACSVYGAQFLLDALYDQNDADYALDLLTSTSPRSWYNMIRAGSTITMEAWDNKYKPNQDWNHAWGAAPANIIPRKLMGIEPLEPGFRKIRIKPQPGDLEHAKIKVPTIRGEVTVSFVNKAGEGFTLDVTTPANTIAEIYLPYPSGSQKITSDGKPVSVAREGEYAVVHNVGSGSHTFRVAE